MFNLLAVLQKDNFNPRFYVAAATDNMSFPKAQLLENSLAGCKFLIFAHHQPMIDAIHECLIIRPVQFTLFLFILEIIALTKTVKNFQKKKVGCIWIDGGKGLYQGSCSMVLSIEAGVVGLTLTVASTFSFTEQSWTPGNLIQAKDRAHRIGQVFSHSLSRKERVVTSLMTTLRKQIISNEKNSHI
ncbi:hypothetical protein Ahy_B02g060414 [Arachis hypogaea]|uniref:Helicase C-terminal domain-containing protein n=1 Tax=Arachis hypogaea TaxID=3818 RepID=A0A445AID8_ARAHY|nr:hypothetical protein Ahy_B02g060414 [Arachis hypogaea]